MCQLPITLGMHTNVAAVCLLRLSLKLLKFNALFIYCDEKSLVVLITLGTYPENNLYSTLT